MKHTQGNWKFSPLTDNVVTDLNQDANIICSSPRSNLVSYRNWGNNAKLIAAAPELLAAAKEAVSTIDSLIYEHKDSNHSYRRSLLQIKNAIKKATE